MSVTAAKWPIATHSASGEVSLRTIVGAYEETAYLPFSGTRAVSLRAMSTGLWSNKRPRLIFTDDVGFMRVEHVWQRYRQNV